MRSGLLLKAAEVHALELQKAGHRERAEPSRETSCVALVATVPEQRWLRTFLAGVG